MENLLGLDSQDFDLNNVPADHTFDLESADIKSEVATNDEGNQPSGATTPSTPLLDMVDKAVSAASYNLRESNLKQDISSYDPELKQRYNEFPTIYNNRFDPAADNESIALQNWDTWDAVSTGIAGFKDSFKQSFVQSVYVWPRMAKSLLLLDADYMKPSESEVKDMAYQMKQNELENPVFYKPGTEDDFLTKGFLAESIQNLGFTFGTLGELATEWAATTAVSGGLAALGQAPAAGTLLAGEAANTASKLPSFWKNITKLFVGSATDDVAKAATTVGGTFELGPTRYMLQQPIRTGKVVAEDLRLLNASTNVGLNGVKVGVDVWDNALKLASKVPIVGSVADAARIAKAARNAELTGAELLKIGAGGLRRGFAEWQMAAGEASIEMGGNYKQFMDENIYEAERKGESITGDAYLDLQNRAFQSAGADFATNVAILAISNKLMFGNLLGKFGTDSKLLLQLKNAIGGDLAKELGIKTVMSGNAMKHYQLKGFQGLFGTVGIANQIRRDFGAKVMAWELGKSSLRGVTNFQVVEGLQENLQEISNRLYIDYYTDLYRSGVGNWGKSFDEAVNSQMNKQGAKTFLMGAMTGMFVNPITNSIQYARNAATYSGQKHAESVGRTIDILNNFYNNKSDTEKILKEHVKNIKLQSEYAENMRDAVANGNKYQYFNNKDSALINAVMLAKRTGTMDYMHSFLKGYGENFTPQEFQEAFGYTPEELKKSSPKEVMDEIASGVKRYSDLYDKYQTKYGLMLSVEDYINDPAAKMKYSIRKAALMDAIETVSFAEAKGQQSTIRSEEILKRVSALPSIGNSLSTSWNTLIDSREMSDRSLILNNEIKALKESGPLDAQAKAIIADKEREVELLEYLSKNMYEVVTEEDPNNPDKKVQYTRPKRSTVESERKEIANRVSEYLALKNKQSGLSTVVNKDEVYSALDDMYDYIVLGRDHHDYMQAVNLLSDPDNMTKFYENTMDARAGAHARLLYDQFQELGEISETGKNFIDTPEVKKLMDDLLQFSKLPYGTYKNYNKLQEILDQVVEKKNELLLGQLTESLRSIQEQQQKLRDQAEIDAKIGESRKPVDIFTLLENEETEDEGLQYMADRYDIEEIRNTFPFESEDPQERVVTRYYKHPDGTRIAFQNKVRIPVEFDIYNDDSPVKLDSPELIMEYLKIWEDAVYQKYLETKNQASEKETDEKTEEADNAKVKLISYVDSTVVENGNAGILRMNEQGGFYIEFPDGTVKEIQDSNPDSTFDDYSTLSRVIPLLPEEERELVSAIDNPVVEATYDGELLIDYVVDVEGDIKTLKSVTINGISWQLEYNDQGELTAFVRQYQRKKGKNSRIMQERLSVRNPKGAQYAAAVNSFLNLVIDEIPESISEMADMSEALDQALNAVDTVIDGEATSKRVREEIIDQFKLNKIINVNTPDNITELRTKFGNPETRSQLTSEELVELALWASDLRKKIKKQWSIYMGNPIVNGFLTQLVKEYINPIDSLLSEIDKKDGTKGSREDEVTPRNTTKKERAKKSAETGESRKRKQGAERVSEEPKPEKTRKGKKPISDALNEIEDKAEKKRRKSSKKQVESTDTSQRIQKMSLGGATRIINKVTNNKINKMRDSISASISNPEIGLPIDPFSSLNENSTYCE
jgi:hypothetical protein